MAKISRTIIKGLKQVKRTVGISYDIYGMPILDTRLFEVESDSVIRELDFNLIVDDEFDITYTSSIPHVLEDGTIEKIPIISERISDDNNSEKIFIINLVIEDIEQYFNYDEIMEQYHKELGKYYDNFIKQYEGNNSMQVQIQHCVDGGMTESEIIKNLRDDQNFDRNERVKLLRKHMDGLFR